ncbi:MAG: hypothetical protein JST58_19375 [Bacteroidetes bacterium]|nr:hypothetical protein [Bacteroidota bacterium]
MNFYNTGNQYADTFFSEIYRFKTNIYPKYYTEVSFLQYVSNIDRQKEIFKNDIQKKIENYPQRELSIYFISIESQISEFFLPQPSFTKTKLDCAKYFAEYNIEEEELFEKSNPENKLSIVLSNTQQNIIAKFGERDWELNLEPILETFFDYYSSCYLNEMKAFINERRDSFLNNRELSGLYNLANTNDLKNVVRILEICFRISQKNGDVLNNDDFKRLVKSTLEMIKEKEVPNNLEKISETPHNKHYLIYIYFLIHKTMYGSGKRQVFFYKFLKEMFAQLSSYNIKTIEGKFTTEPKGFYADFPQLKELFS